MNVHALSVLEFEQAMEKVAKRAANPLGREALRSFSPGTDASALREELARVAEVLLFLEDRPDWAPPPFPDVRSSLRLLAVEGGILEALQVWELLRFLDASRELSGALKAEAATPALDRSHLARLDDRLPVKPDVESHLASIVDEEGAIRDSASPDLRSIRGRLRTIRGQIVRKLEGYLSSLPDRLRVENASVSIRDGRYVIPIRREGKSHVGGIIHGESSTGATLFVEPPLAIGLMNELRELEREEAREIHRILREVTGRLRPLAGELDAGLEAHVDLDTLWARALTARAWQGTPPELLDSDDEVVRVVDGRHPLLVEQGIDVVPFFLDLLPDERVVVVSGPNTGGKTVLLKAIGLIHLLAQSGVVPPVGPGTRLPVLTDVFADIGDEQSIAESLSTFSAHLANSIEILEGAGTGTLVLMDEVGTGTDPSEGAALARAILEALVERGSRAVVTSHLGALKRLDAEGSGIVNASLLFDPDRIEPTYRLQKGRPGRSYGLAIARRSGLPARVLDRAEELVDSGELDVERLLETLEEKERALSSALSEAELARTEARGVREEVERRRSRLEERERTEEARARERTRQLLLEAREEVEAAIREVREGEGEARDEIETRARQRVEAAARKQRLEDVSVSPSSDRPGTLAPVAEGDRVRMRGSGTKGVVRELREDRVTVEVGGLRLQLPRSEVERTAPEGVSERTDPGGRRSGGWSAPEVEARPEADLRGLRVDEVELELGRALDGAVVGGLSELRVIHGKGTGAVKARVLELLRADPRVSEFRPGGLGEGGAGVTVAVLK